MRYHWPSVVEELREGHRRDPETWHLMLEGVPYSVATQVRRRSVRALQLDDGFIEVRVRNSRVVDYKRRGDMWMRFVPFENEEDDSGR